MYLYVGQMIALSVIHGGLGLVLLSSTVVDYLFGGMAAVSFSIDDVPDQLEEDK